MARGTESKNQIFKKLREVYPDAFFEEEGKILRIPMLENGDRIEVKVQLTAAKTNLQNELPSAFADPGSSVVNLAKEMNEPTPAKKVTEVSEEEKANVNKLLASLGL